MTRAQHGTERAHFELRARWDRDGDDVLLGTRPGAVDRTTRVTR
jgi:hypothetical protein